MSSRLPARFLKKCPKEEMETLPIRKFEGPVRLVLKDDQVPAALEEMTAERVLGFDTETKPVFRRGQSNPPALMQFAGEEKVWLFHLAVLQEPALLVPILSNGKILKAGVAIGQDVKQLKMLFDYQEAAFLDLGEVARDIGMAASGLRTMAASLFGCRISKRARCSNWAKNKLEPYQIDYAATDAWMSREIFLFFKKHGVLGKDGRPVR